MRCTNETQWNGFRRILELTILLADCQKENWKKGHKFECDARKKAAEPDFAAPGSRSADKFERAGGRPQLPGQGRSVKSRRN
jgi:hypothetical protein